MHLEEKIKRTMRGGLISAVPVPRYESGQIHEAAQAAYARYLAAQRIAGVAVWVHTGRGLYLSREQRQYILHSWKSALHDSQVVICGVGALQNDALKGSEQLKKWQSDSITMAKDAISGGADALLVFPPVILNPLPEREREDAVVAYHSALAALGCPLILFYLYEAAGGMAYSLELLRRLLAIPGVIGIKIATLDSVMTMQRTARLLEQEFPDQLHITGEDRMFGYALMRGAQSALVGLGAAFPNVQADLITAFQENRYADFIDLSARVDGFAEETFTEPMDKYILRMLHCLAAAKVIPEEAAFDIAGYEMTKEELAEIRKAIGDYRLY
ncbi:dihydrodipicolinate synthase family protein [Paenibacillus fonticola]|uniref:dihydrodipicolinate synthase family protein n=1 Tax=Paenibacillus fonticola TaxID=379896 RepID=UPI000380DAFC|nr:dihydrodipicolinate synthase family protein [Paenibacillus fonticola]